MAVKRKLCRWIAPVLFLHANLTKDVPSLQAHGGDRLAGSPQYNANLCLEYEFRIADHRATVRADSIYVGPF